MELVTFCELFVDGGLIVAVEGKSNRGDGKWKEKWNCEGEEANGKKHLSVKRLKDCLLVVILLLHLFVHSPSSLVALKGTGHVIFSVLLGDIFLHHPPPFLLLIRTNVLNNFLHHNIIIQSFFSYPSQQNGIILDSEAEQIVRTSPGFIRQGNP